MLDAETQINSGLLVCPRTHQSLSREGESLITPDRQYTYPYINDVPILIDAESQAAYLTENNQLMVQEYAAGTSAASERKSILFSLKRPLRAAQNFILNPSEDYRAAEAREAWRIVSDQPDDALCLAVGGGPMRYHPQFVNVNIGPFKNVDVVADAYELPYRDGTVNAILCEAVLEHLEFPEAAVKEMYRVLVPGGQLFASTPFLQAYHGYPNHFQNFTLTGQQRLFIRNGFELVSSGVCVGPTYVVSEIVQCYLRYYIPFPIGRDFLLNLLRYPFALLRRLDKKIVRFGNASDVASTTYVHARKPG
jgi:SAM-dependent methyltransferase